MKFTSKVQFFLTNVRSKMYRLKPIRGNQKTSQQLAIEYFDFFYDPIFKTRWHSIRLGLMSEQKLCALMNSSTDYDESYFQLIDSGAVDLKQILLGKDYSSKSTGDPETAKSSPFEAVIKRQVRSKILQKPENGHEKPDSSFKAAQESQNRILDAQFRTTPESLHSFVPSEERLVRTQDDVEISKIAGKDPAYYQPADVTIIPDEEIKYPEMLKVLIYPRKDVTRFPVAPLNAEGVPTYYLMDASTIFSIVALNLGLDDKVLDLCMSPGGTSLAMLHTLLPSRLTSNDVTGKMRGRLTLNKNLPQAARELRDRIQLTSNDPSDPTCDWPIAGQFKKVLVNVPCTYDREALSSDEDEPSMFHSSMNAEKLALPRRQASLLQTGMEALQVGGDLVYTAQTLSPIQGDAVVDEALSTLRQRNRSMRIAIKNLSPLAEKFCRKGVFRFYPFCRYGELIVPHICSNFGPMYVCKMTRLE